MSSESIEGKLSNAINKKMGKKSGSSLTPEMAANMFIKILKEEIESCGARVSYSKGKLGDTAIDALTNIKHGTPYTINYKVNLGDKGLSDISATVTSAVDISFAGDLHRDSLQPETYRGADNIAQLLNNGYEAGGSVYGNWNGHNANIVSLNKREGADFIGSAVRKFMAKYAKKYGVIDIKVNDIYKY